MFGSHLSIAGGLHKAILEAERLSMDTVQVFTANPRCFHQATGTISNPQQGQARPLNEAAIEQWTAHAQRLGFLQTVSHDSYLINLASPDDELWRKSIDLYTEEFSRCSALKIPYLVMHPGAHMDSGEEAGLSRVAQALDIVFERWPRGEVVTCLEITAGQGTSLGYKLEHLAEIISRSGSPQRFGVCLDTAHLWAAGYDFRGRKYAKFMKQVDATVGIDRIQVLHLNDSKRELGSRVDRHAHIGHGTIGLDGFRPFVRDKAFKSIPKILETPKEKTEDGRDWDAVNLETLLELQ